MGIFRKVIEPQFFRYLVIGGITALVYFGFFALSVEGFQLNYRVGMSIAYVLAVTFHFLANRKFTFYSKDGKLIYQWLRYLAVLIINYLVTLVVISFFVDQLGLSAYLAVMLSILVTVCVGYFASKFWVFRNRESVSD